MEKIQYVEESQNMTKRLDKGAWKLCVRGIVWRLKKLFLIK